MNSGDRTELLHVLKRERGIEKAEAERHGQMALLMDKLVTLLETGGNPPADLFSQLPNRNGASSSTHVLKDEVSRGYGAPLRKFRRQPKFESFSTVQAISTILSENGPTHADELARQIFAVDQTDFQKVKSAVVSEAVKAIKRGVLRRTGENIFALAEKKA